MPISEMGRELGTPGHLPTLLCRLAWDAASLQHSQGSATRSDATRTGGKGAARECQPDVTWKFVLLPP